MKPSFLILPLVAAAVTPFVALSGCSSKLAPEGAVASDLAIPPSKTTADGGVGGGSRAPCAYDTAPLPLPDPPPPSNVVAECTTYCARSEIQCFGCVSVECMPNCETDALRPESGKEYVAWMECMLAKRQSWCDAGDDPCHAEYCTYEKAGTPPGYFNDTSCPLP